MPDPAPVLDVEDLNAWYGESHILHGVTFDIREGEIVSLLGRNGAGKTTTLRAIMGLVGRREGKIRFGGEDLMALSTDRIARRGIGYVPEERGIFASLTVRENLELPPVIRSGGLDASEIFTLFPNLQERLGGASGTRLSGGEQQMLAIARILRTGATLLLLDEPTEGLAPVIIEQIGVSLRRLQQRGLTILLVEQNFRFAARVADRHYVLEHGQVIGRYSRAEAETRENELQELLGV